MNFHFLEGRHLAAGDMQPPDFNRFRANNFDLIRLFAALQVLVFHTLDRFDIPAPVWIQPLKIFSGVPIFFVVSGFLVSASYERSSSLTSYARARALRIFPGLWMCVILTSVAVLAFGYHLISPSGVTWLLAQFAGLIYTPSVLKDFGIGSYNGSLWTIPIELQFYILLPLLYAISRRVGGSLIVWGAMLLAAIALSVILDSYYGRSDDGTYHGLAKILQYTFGRHIYLFIFGIILQRSKLYRHPLMEGKAVPWLIILIVANIIDPVGLVFKMVLGMFAISLAYTTAGVGEKIVRGQDISYGIYIYHGLVINLMVELGAPSSAFNVVIVAALAILCAALSWKLIERPAIRRKQHVRELMARHVW